MEHPNTLFTVCSVWFNICLHLIYVTCFAHAERWRKTQKYQKPYAMHCSVHSQLLLHTLIP